MFLVLLFMFSLQLHLIRIPGSKGQELALAEVLACSYRGLSSQNQLNMPTSMIGLWKRRLFAPFVTSCKPTSTLFGAGNTKYMFQKIHKVLILQDV